MRLMSPAPGEVVDRLTILKLKIEAAKKQDRQDLVANFELEKEALFLYYSDRKFSLCPEQTDKLEKINARLWDLEDDQRVILNKSDFEDMVNKIREKPDACQADIFDFCHNAISIIRLNDARAALVQEINKLCGINQQEKIYSASAN